MIILIDCDGVLTDGTLTIDHRGEKLFKKFHTRDVRAIRELVFNGWEVYIVTADDWQGIFHFAQKVGAVVIIEREKWKLKERFKEYYAVGDDTWDAGLLEGAVKAFCPSDADVYCKQVKGVQQLRTRSGQGVIAEVIHRILK